MVNAKAAVFQPSSPLEVTTCPQLVQQRRAGTWPSNAPQYCYFQAHFALAQLKFVYLLSVRVMGNNHSQRDRVSRVQSYISDISQIITGSSQVKYLRRHLSQQSVFFTPCLNALPNFEFPRTQKSLINWAKFSTGLLWLSGLEGLRQQCWLGLEQLGFDRRTCGGPIGGYQGGRSSRKWNQDLHSAAWWEDEPHKFQSKGVRFNLHIKRDFSPMRTFRN